MLTSRVGGTTVITQNGNQWIGPGHHAFMTDGAGRTTSSTTRSTARCRG